MDPVCTELEQGQAPQSVLRDHKALSQHEKNERGCNFRPMVHGTGTEPVQLWSQGTTLDPGGGEGATEATKSNHCIGQPLEYTFYANNK